MELAETNTMCVGSHSKGIFYSNGGPGKGWRFSFFLNGTSFRVGTGTFLSLPKQNIFAAGKDNLCSLFTGLTCWCWEHHMGRWPKDTSTVYISLKTGRVDSADLSTKLLCRVCTAKSRPWQRWPCYLTFWISEKQLFSLKRTVCFLHPQLYLL